MKIKYDYLGYKIEYEDDGYKYHSICPSRIQEIINLKNRIKIIQFKK